jgi:hypothetical protein
MSHELFKDIPIRRGNQCVIPAIIAKTAPMDKT